MLPLLTNVTLQRLALLFAAGAATVEDDTYTPPPVNCTMSPTLNCRADGVLGAVGVVGGVGVLGAGAGVVGAVGAAGVALKYAAMISAWFAANCLRLSSFVRNAASRGLVWNPKAIHLLIERIDVVNKTTFNITSTLKAVLGETGRGDRI